MTKILQPKTLGIIIASFAFGILFAGTTNMSASADEGIPEWFKGVASFWAEGNISTAEFLTSIEFLLEQEIISVEGYGLLSEAQGEGIDQESLDEIWTAINSLQDQIDGMEGIPGPAGPPGPEGARGPSGDMDDFKIYVVSEKESNFDQYGYLNMYLKCDPGDQMTGISATGQNPDVLLRSMTPAFVPDGEARFYWSHNGEYKTDVYAYVICADTEAPYRANAAVLQMK